MKLLALVMACAPILSATTFNFFTVDDPTANTTKTTANQISDGGVIVGGYSALGISHGYTDNITTNTFATVDATGISGQTITQTVLYGINDIGTEMVGTFVGNSNKFYAMADIGGAFTQIPIPSSYSAANSFANAVNKNGLLGGIVQNTSGATIGFLDNAGTFSNPLKCTFNGGVTLGANTNIYAINDSGLTAGFCNYNGTITGFTYDTANGTNLNSGTWTQYNTPLNIVPAGETLVSTKIYGLDNAGDFAGTFITNLTNHGFYYSASLNQWSELDVPGSTLTIVSGMNNLGMLVGQYNDTSGVTHGFYATPMIVTAGTPEPGTMLLTSIAFGGLFAVVRKRRASRR